MTLSEILDFKLIDVDGFKLSVYNLILLAIVLIATRFLVWAVKVMTTRSFKRRNIDDPGKQFAVIRIAKYFIYVLAVIFGIESVGLNVNVLIASAAGLFVGIGLGMQSLVNDIVSGFILLFEGSTKVGDMVQIDDATGVIETISLRTSEVKTRDNIIMVVPNSKLVNDSVINWSHNEKRRRFHVKVGVSYGSDTTLVKDTLLWVAQQNSDVLTQPAPSVFFNNFGDSSLDFDLMVWTDYTWEAEKLKSDLRFAINDAFAEQGIEIPFPQRDLHLKSGSFTSS